SAGLPRQMLEADQRGMPYIVLDSGIAHWANSMIEQSVPASRLRSGAHPSIRGHGTPGGLCYTQARHHTPIAGATQTRRGQHMPFQPYTGGRADILQQLGNNGLTLHDATLGHSQQGSADQPVADGGDYRAAGTVLRAQLGQQHWPAAR